MRNTLGTVRTVRRGKDEVLGRAIRVVVAIAALCLVVALVWAAYSAYSTARAKPHAASEARVREGLSRDFPGFTISRLTYFRWDPGLSFDAVPFDGYDFVLRMDAVTGFEISGRYVLGSQNEESELPALRHSVFARGGLSPEVLASLARSWVVNHNGISVVMGKDSRTSPSAGSSTLPVTDVQQRAIAKHKALGDLYVFDSSNRVVYWMRLDRARGTWASLGDTTAVISKYAK